MTSQSRESGDARPPTVGLRPRLRLLRPRAFARRHRLRRLGLTGPVLDVEHARLEMSENPVILECGANSGIDTLRFLTRWPTARVYCFEPEPRAIAEWRATVVSPRAELFEAAVAERDGEVTFFRSSGRPPDAADGTVGPYNESGSIRRPTGHLEEHPWVTFEEQIVVPTRALDSWSREHGVGAVDLIWADVQGAEADLVRGAQATLARTRYLYTEYSDRELYDGQVTLDGLLDLLPGWTVLRKFAADVLLVNPAAR